MMTKVVVVSVGLKNQATLDVCAQCERMFIPEV